MMPALTPIDLSEKRVVIRELEGMWRIIGIVDGPPPNLLPKKGRTAFCLMKVNPRYVLYAEVPKRSPHADRAS